MTCHHSCRRKGSIRELFLVIKTQTKSKSETLLSLHPPKRYNTIPRSFSVMSSVLYIYIIGMSTYMMSA